MTSPNEDECKSFILEEIALYCVDDIGSGDIMEMAKALNKFVSGWVNKALETHSEGTKTPLDKL